MSRVHRANGPSLESKVALLQDARTYPDATGRIEAIETHMSWVFLTDTHAYKLKKPVRYEYLDYGTLAARHWACHEELRLNQRLAPGVYLAVVPLAVAGARARLEADGEVVDWLVKMRRLPAAHMLDQVIRTGQVSRTDVERAAEWLALFYRESAPVEIGGGAQRARLARAIDGNRDVLSRRDYALPAARVAEVHRTLAEFVRTEAEIFDRRAAERRILEGHGDLRPEHVCLAPRPIVFDRLEFNRELRIIDPAEELSFLSMECERLGAPFVGPILFDVYARVTADVPPSPLRDFYMAQRATLRARLAALHTADAPPTTWPTWTAAAAAYLQLAARYCERLA